MNRLCLFGFALCINLLAYNSAGIAQGFESPSESVLSESSKPFRTPYEQSLEKHLEDFRQFPLYVYSAQSLRTRKFKELSDPAKQAFPLLALNTSLDLFQSLANFFRQRDIAAQRENDQILREAPPDSRSFSEGALLSALEFYSHQPLRREDVEQAIGRLETIHNLSGLPANVQPEISFWLAEGYRAQESFDKAERYYWDAVGKSSRGNLSALGNFRLAELEEHEGKYDEAARDFRKASLIESSQLRTVSSLRMAAVLRSQHYFDKSLAELDRADSLYTSLPHEFWKAAREIGYISPLLQSLFLERPEEDRILGSDVRREQLTHTPSQLVSAYFESDIDLVRGSVLSELGRYGEAANVLSKGLALLTATQDSENVLSLNPEYSFDRNALLFEQGWALFRQEKYDAAAQHFLELASQDTLERHSISRSAALPLRDQSAYYDPFYNEDLQVHTSVLEAPLYKKNIDTDFYYYNDFPERSRFYAGVASERAGNIPEAERIFIRLSQDKSVLYADQANYQLGLLRFSQGQYFQAQSLLEPISSERSLSGAFSSFLMGELMYRKNVYERAEEYFSQALSGLPNTYPELIATAHLERGLSLVPLGGWKAAKDELSAFFASGREQAPSKTDEALYWLGRSYGMLKEYDSAGIAYKRLLSEFPQSPRIIDAQYQYAWSLFRENNFQKAAPEFLRILELDSISRYSYDALARAGDSHYALAETRTANNLYNQAVERPAFNDLRTTRAEYQLALTRVELDSLRSAITEYQKLLTKFSNSDIADRAYFNYALSAYEINQNALAETAIATLVSRFHSSSLAPRALLLAGNEHERNGDPHNAIGFYERLIAEYPTSVDALPGAFALQDILVSEKQPQRAIALSDSLSNHVTNLDAQAQLLLRKGVINLKSNNPQEAETIFQNFLDKYPGSNDEYPSAKYLLAEAALSLKDTLRATKQLAELTSTFDSSDEAPHAYLTLARIYRSQSQLPSAIENYRYASRYFSSDYAPIALTELATLYTETRQTDSALLVYHEIATNYLARSATGAHSLLMAATLERNTMKEAAKSDLAVVIAEHPSDVYGGAAEVQSGLLNNEDKDWPAALNAFARAKELPLSPQSQAERLLGTARASIALDRKREAIQALQSLKFVRGDFAEKSEGAKLLMQLAPQKKKAAHTKKGAAQ